MAEFVHASTARGVATITLDSQHNRNALSSQLMAELTEQLGAAQADDAVRVIVLTHEGRVFCSGMDLSEARGGSAAGMGVNALPPILHAIWDSPKPVVARVAGPARAGGVGLIGACDIAVAASTATFAFTEVRIGVVPAVISITVLPRLLPRSAHELFLTGELFDGDRAAAIGLVNSAVDVADLDAEVGRYVDMLALGAPGALAATKLMLRRARPASMAEDFAAMLALSAEHFAGEEGQEGIAAFTEKRPARWVPHS
ncbi:MAG: enoyl-CoA hydratase-related protein [Geodermatophilaceae bacterium]